MQVRYTNAYLFSCYYLSTHVSIAIPIVAVILYVFVISVLLRCSLSDPGFLPRARPDETKFIEAKGNLQLGTSKYQFKTFWTYVCKIFDVNLVCAVVILGLFVAHIPKLQEIDFGSCYNARFVCVELIYALICHFSIRDSSSTEQR